MKVRKNAMKVYDTITVNMFQGDVATTCIFAAAKRVIWFSISTITTFKLINKN